MSIRAVLLLTTAATAVVGSTTRNIVHKNEEMAASPQEHRALMTTVGLNQMVCNESLETKDGSIVCTFRVMPPAATTTAPKIIHDCLFSPSMNDGGGSNFCVTTEISRSTFAEVATHQQAAANNQVVYNPIPATPPLVQQPDTTIPSGSDLFVDTPMTIINVQAELSSAVIPPTAPADSVIPSRSDTIQIPTPVNGPNCPSTMPSTGDTCSWVTNTNPPYKYSAYQCGYLSGDEVPQLPGTLILVCKCDGNDTFVCAPARDEVYLGVQSSASF